MSKNKLVLHQQPYSAIRTLIGGCLVVCAAGLAHAGFQDPLETPAKKRSALTERPYMAIVETGTNVVAVGPRGLIVHSADQGKTWQQAEVPVQVDLLGVHFPTVNEGWAVGHDGLVLHTSNAGQSWSKQIDGRISAEHFKRYYSATGAGFENAQVQAEKNFTANAPLPFLDVWFEDVHTGYAVGSFGVIARTHDGGKTWQPMLHKIDNQQSLNLNAISNIAGDLYIAGEKGMIYKYDRATDFFSGIETGYGGSFFGIVGDTDVLLAYGLRGVVYRSTDKGQTWQALAMPNEQTITTGTRTSTGFLLGNVQGQLLKSDAEGKRFSVDQNKQNMLLTGVKSLKGDLCLFSGVGGLRTDSCPK